MQRRLYLVRHGKSDWNATAGGDHERPLAERGRDAATRIGRFLAATGRQPNLILSSSAVRARTTAELACEAGAWQTPIQIRPRLYGATAGTALEEASSAPDDVERLMLAGHEPTSSEIVAYLTGGMVRFPTAAVACIRVTGSTWNDALTRAPRDNSLAWFLIPRLLPPADA